MKDLVMGKISFLSEKFKLSLSLILSMIYFKIYNQRSSAL